ncbi:uncharacterized protein LOC143286004 [Babylonia areolata]|uniref:uncharacterized protein LOC143286004 n=1 Tax=Babylonia areolata TaxID=304850 RepID=UPI003FD59E40
MDTESHPRPRRARHDSSKLYDRERKDLELAEVLDVLQRYVDYGGGINCCVCGKLYKSRVCFIKHLWEHTIYWDLFAGDKNHMRVLSIQAALILYATCQQPFHHIPVDNLLVTSPHTTDSGNDTKPPVHSADLSSPTMTDVASEGLEKGPCPLFRQPVGISTACDTSKLLPTTPVKQNTSPRIPSTPKKKMRGNINASVKRRPPPKLELKMPEKRKVPVAPQSSAQGDTSPNTLFHPDSIFRTPVKQRIPLLVPSAPQKSKKFAESKARQNRQVRRCLLPTADDPDLHHWKDTDSSACKRKRSE